MDEDYFVEDYKKNDKVIKKSTFNSLIIAIIIVTGIAAFFAGTFVSNLNSEQVSQMELENAIAELELKILEKQNEWSNLETVYAIDLFNQYSKQINLEQEQFTSCLSSAKYVKEIQNDLNDGRAYGITGTPGFFIGNQEIGFVELKGAQPFESFKKVIDSQLGN